MRILYLSAHAILEYDTLDLLTRMGHDVFSLGAYLDPAHPGDDKRPPLDAPDHPELRDVIHPLAGPDKIWTAKNHLPDALVDWAEVVYVDAEPEAWIIGNWAKIAGKQVIWRTIGQSNPNVEARMAGFRVKGVQIIRYSPNEQAMPNYAGHDAIIRFSKNPADWGPWIGDEAHVVNIAQHDRVPHGRDEFLNWPWVEAATKGLRFDFYGPHTQEIGGHGSLSYDAMRDVLRHAAAYVYSGTQPASYTLGLMEAMLSGVPVVSIGPSRMWLPALFEGHVITGFAFDDPARARLELVQFLDPAMDNFMARHLDQRGEALRLFSYDAVIPQWEQWLGKVAVAA